MSTESSRLYAILLNTGLQTRDNPLYQLLRQLITDIGQLGSEVTAISSGGNSTIINETIIGLIDTSGPIDDNDSNIPLIGATGAVGSQGTQGLSGESGIDGLDAISTIGPIGNNGNNGRDSFISDGIDGLDGLSIVGAIGPQGIQGISGNDGLDAFTDSFNSSNYIPPFGNDVNYITGTANQVIVSSPTGNITLSLPQSIATTSSVQFGKVGIGVTPTRFLDILGVTEQARFSYNSSNFLSLTVDSVGIAFLTPSAGGSVRITSTTLPLIVAYDLTNYLYFSVDASGNTSLTTVGSLGKLTMAPSVGAFSVLSNVTTGITNGSAINLNANTVTTGTGLYLSGSGLTSGKLADLQISGAQALANQTALNILTSGANTNAGITTYGAQISNTHSTNTSINVALYLNASSGATANYGLIVNAGSSGFGLTAPLAMVHINGASDVNNGQLRIASSSGNTAGLTLWTAGAATMRNWQIACDYVAAGDLVFAQSTTNVGNPTVSIMSLSSTGVTATTFFGALSGNATTATTVTTNANLTGPITSIGNATSIASQTGTGTTFAMSVSPTFTGNVAIGTSTTALPLHINLSGTASVSVAIGDTPFTATGSLAGWGFTRFTDGSLYSDFKTIAGGLVNFRSGAGAEVGSSRTWMTVNPATAKVAIGAFTPSAYLDVLGTTEQLRLRYDTSNYNSFTISSVGSLTIAAIGTNPSITLTSSGTGVVSIAGKLDITTAGLITKYNNITTAGWGAPAIYSKYRSTGNTAALVSIGGYGVSLAADGSFIVVANINVTVSTAHNFTVVCTYTDEGGVARVTTLSFSQTTGVFITAITNLTGVGAYAGIPLYIRAQSGSLISFATLGTFTSVTYNMDAAILQIG